MEVSLEITTLTVESLVILSSPEILPLVLLLSPDSLLLVTASPELLLLSESTRWSVVSVMSAF
jgi:hypothetical protein